MVVDSGGAAGMDSSTDRQTNVQAVETAEPEQVHDVLAKTEEASPTVDAIMAQAKEYVQKTQKELPVSASATKATNKDDFEYEKLALADDGKLESTLKKVEERQKALEEKLEDAKVKKFDRN